MSILSSEDSLHISMYFAPNLIKVSMSFSISGSETYCIIQPYKQKWIHLWLSFPWTLTGPAPGWMNLKVFIFLCILHDHLVSDGGNG